MGPELGSRPEVEVIEGEQLPCLEAYDSCPPRKEHLAGDQV